jgi:transposase-like protein
MLFNLSCLTIGLGPNLNGTILPATFRYLYRAVNKFGNTVDFLLTKRRMRGSVQLFLRKAIGNNGKPRVVNTVKSGASKSVIRTINRDLLSVQKNQDLTMQIFEQYS